MLCYPECHERWRAGEYRCGLDTLIMWLCWEWNEWYHISMGIGHQPEPAWPVAPRHWPSPITRLISHWDHHNMGTLIMPGVMQPLTNKHAHCSRIQGWEMMLPCLHSILKSQHLNDHHACLSNFPPWSLSVRRAVNHFNELLEKYVVSIYLLFLFLGTENLNQQWSYSPI